jgi:hypothetical protein
LERRWSCPPGGRGYYDFENAAKPGVEIGEVLILWLSQDLMLAFFDFRSKSANYFYAELS